MKLGRIFAVVAFALSTLLPGHACAWGDDGHKVVALIAEKRLLPEVRSRMSAMLSADPDSLTAHDVADEATWADRYRDSDRHTTNERYNATRRWHFADIELGSPDLATACFGRPPLGTSVASLGSPEACIVDKVDQFEAELRDPRTNPEERLAALKFLLHLVGDLHQPLHAADDRDVGGNKKHVHAAGSKPGTLHHYWDVEFVRRLGESPREIANRLSAATTNAQASSWSQGTASDWAMESFEQARAHAYGRLREPDGRGIYALDSAYVNDAVAVTAIQLSRAGVRLAVTLNRALAAR